MKNLTWRLGIVGAVVIAAIVYVLPTLKEGLWPHKRINLGLDLQGGMHLVLEVDTPQAIANKMDTTAEELRLLMKKKRIRHAGIQRGDGARIALTVTGTDNVDKFDRLLDDEFPNLRMVKRSAEGGNMSIVLDLPEREQEFIQRSAVQQALETIRNRIDQFGVSEPDIRRQGTRRILVQLPGVKDTQRAKQLIGKTALLEFKLVDDTRDARTVLQSGEVPPGWQVLWQVRQDPATNREVKTPYLLKKRASLTGEYLTEARVEIDSQYGEPYVSITFDKKGARIFERVTGENIKRQLAIVLDDKVYSAPVIQDRIAGGEARITGAFSTDEAHDLAIVLRAGALPAPVDIIEERTVGPSLGSDSIRKGLISMLVGGVLVVLFMAVYYQRAGVIADGALLLNILLVAAGLAAFQATLTLPGIAGIILTIGMAVDANVLIFERIREETKLGRTPRAAVDAGYQRATLTILDANVTTLIAALVLFQFGTGPVKGFAVTLSLGVVAGLFTSLIVTRVVFDFILGKRRIQRLSI